MFYYYDLLEELPTGVAGPSPFYQTSWNNPVNRVRLPLQFEQDGFPPLLNLGTKPFLQTDWPNPLPNKPREYDRGSYDASPTWLTKPFLQTEWPNPRAALRKQIDEVWATNLNLFKNPIPFSQTNWPNPNRTAPKEWGFFDGTEYWLLVQATSPFAQLDWPNPVKIIPREFDRGYSDPTEYWLFIQPVSIQHDFPNPVVGKWTPVNLGFIQNTSPELKNIIISPVIAQDWPNPTLGTVRRQDFSPPQPLTLTSFIPPPPDETVPSGRYWKWEQALKEEQVRSKALAERIQQAAQAISSRGGIVRAKVLSPKQRTVIASNAAKARWK